MLPLVYVAGAEFFSKMALLSALMMSDPLHAMRIDEEQTAACAAYGIAYLVWLISARIWRLSPSTAAGFHAAGSALAGNAIGELALAFHGGPDAEHYLGTPGPLVRLVAIAALVGGLAAVLAASVADVRLRRRVPDWAVPP
jgi:hypothetical protein